MADFLEEVNAKTRERLGVQKSKWSLEQLKRGLKKNVPAHPFRKAIHQTGNVAVIAEIKQASPSAGLIRKEENMAGRMKAYAKGGASALSILTEETYFYGSPQLLVEARAIVSLPLLRKDFIIDPYQIVESKSLGADAILLITSLLPGPQLREFIEQAEAIGLETLVEIHDERDLEQAVQAQAKVIGINNRNLRTLRVDTKNAEKLLAIAPKRGVTRVVESGIISPSELPRLKQLGAHAVLVGEILMRAEDPERLVKEFVFACRK